MQESSLKRIDPCWSQHKKYRKFIELCWDVQLITNRNPVFRCITSSFGRLFRTNKRNGSWNWISSFFIRSFAADNLDPWRLRQGNLLKTPFEQDSIVVKLLAQDRLALPREARKKIAFYVHLRTFCFVLCPLASARSLRFSFSRRRRAKLLLNNFLMFCWSIADETVFSVCNFLSSVEHH